MKKILLLIGAFCAFATMATAQDGFGWGIKGGLAVGTQSWNNGSTGNGTNTLFSYHGAAFIESGVSDSTRVALFAQLGYHVRGSAISYRSGSGYDATGALVNYESSRNTFEFNNISLQLGAKRRGVFGYERAYYSFALRADYTVSTNLLPSDAANSYYWAFAFPRSNFVNNFNYGISVSTGYQFPVSELSTGFVELSLHPDVSNQYYRPRIVTGYFDPNSGSSIVLEEQSIRNFTVELTVGFRFTQKYEYSDY